MTTWLVKCAIIVLLTAVVGAQTNDTWNYNLNGTDWGTNFTSCGSATSSSLKSPITIRNTDIINTKTSGLKNYTSYVWCDWGFTFMPNYKVGGAVATFAGFSNWIYKIQGSFGGVYLPEPAKS